MVAVAIFKLRIISDQRGDNSSCLTASFLVAAKILSFRINAVFPSVVCIEEVLGHDAGPQSATDMDRIHPGGALLSDGAKGFAHSRGLQGAVG